SFVRCADDITGLQYWLSKQGKKCAIVAKMERPEALINANEIVQVADVVMIARGDLGVELPPEQVPVAQQTLIDIARLHHKPVIVATQVLESMIEHARPTRAEATDIFHAVSGGACGVMLSGETAVGGYPVESVEMMSRVIFNAEAYLWQKNAFALTDITPDGEILPFGSAVARSTAQLSRDLMVRGIVVLSCTGVTASTISSARPEAPILGVSPNADACRKMNMLWGVIPVRVKTCLTDNQIELAKMLVKEFGLAQEGDSILLVQGFHEKDERNHPSVTALKV
ncbi:MAG: pyruvate kinase, partial [Ghiorsea sp.]|nr:pyruvate kinase [Ghiorsea sp.]